jgi:hypothetical protein
MFDVSGRGAQPGSVPERLPLNPPAPFPSFPDEPKNNSYSWTNLYLPICMRGNTLFSGMHLIP